MEFYIKKKDVQATIKWLNNNAVIQKGSTAALELKSSFPKSLIELRKDLVHKGIMEASGENYVFTIDYKCSSASRASSLVVGTSSNGKLMWKNEEGETLKKILRNIDFVE
jgi:hypothetical protein